MKKNKIISIIFAIFFYIIYNISLFVWVPVGTSGGFFSNKPSRNPELVWFIVIVVLPICFWLTRFYLKETNKWHKCGTILFHSLNGFSILWCVLVVMEICPIPKFYPERLLKTIIHFTGIEVLGCLLIIDLLLVGVKWLVHLIELRHEKRP